MVAKIIRDYMEGGAKKLTVPGFGTFMRRGGSESAPGGDIVFVDLLRGDDATLREMVEDAGPHTELEAMALVDRFIFETRAAIERTGSATIPGFGTMTIDHKGVYQFQYSPGVRAAGAAGVARPEKETVTQEKLFVPPTPAPPNVKPPQPTPRPVEKTAPARPQPGKPQPPRRPGKQSGKQKMSRSDLFIVIAIVAAVVALAAMIFGLTTAGMPFLER